MIFVFFARPILKTEILIKEIGRMLVCRILSSDEKKLAAKKVGGQIAAGRTSTMWWQRLGGLAPQSNIATRRVENRKLAQGSSSAGLPSASLRPGYRGLPLLFGWRPGGRGTPYGPAPTRQFVSDVCNLIVVVYLFGGGPVFGLGVLLGGFF